MSDHNSTPNRGWLPTLNAGERFPESDPEQTRTTVVPATFGQDVTEAQERIRENLLVQDWPSALEAQFGLSSPNQATETVPVADEESVAGESIESLKERLAYYEHFDSLIRDNVSRSAALFQAVFAEREKVRFQDETSFRAADSIAAEIETRVHAERLHTQHILMSLMDEATYLQQRADTLIQRLAEAITEMATYDITDDEPVSGACDRFS